MMVEYQNNGKIAVFRGYRFVRDDKTGYYLSSRKVGDKRKRLHVVVWEHYNGPIPKGYEVHHCDTNKSNNENSNFELILSKNHRQLHGEKVKDNKELMNRLTLNLMINAQPKAKEWHGSEVGKQWHSQNGKKTWESRKPTNYTCTNCGRSFQSLNIYTEHENRFCSNNCKSSYRRKQGFDNETRICVICGEEFIINRYTKGQTCSTTCRGRLKCRNSQESKASNM